MSFIGFTGKLFDIASMLFAIGVAIYLFNDKHIDRGSQTLGAYVCVILAIFTMLGLSNNLILNQLSFVGIIVTVAIEIVIYHNIAKHRAMRIYKHNKAFKSGMKMKQALRKSLPPKYRAKADEYDRKMKNDPLFRKRQFDKHRKDINYLEHGKIPPSMEHDMKDIDRSVKDIESLSKQTKEFHNVIHKLLKKHPKFKGINDKVSQRMKHDKAYKKEIRHHKGKAWESFKPYYVKLRQMARQELKDEGKPIPLMLKSDPSKKKTEK